MHISPQRRRRILRAHNLRQHGSSLRDIAHRLHLSAATVHADLRALETDWTDIAQAIRNDLLLQQVNRLNRLINRLIQQPPPASSPRSASRPTSPSTSRPSPDSTPCASRASTPSAANSACSSNNSPSTTSRPATSSNSNNSPSPTTNSPTPTPPNMFSPTEQR